MTDWSVRVGYRANGFGPHLTDEQADQLAAFGFPVAVDGDLNRVVFHVDVQADGLEAAVAVAAGRTRSAVAALGLAADPTYVDVCLWQDGPGRISLAPLGLLSMGEVAQQLGVSRQRAHELAGTDPAFPAPVDRTPAGAIYDRDAVRRYAANRRRAPGRPRSHRAN